MRALLLVMVCGCGSVAPKHDDAAVGDAPRDAAADSSRDGAVVPASCAALHAADPQAASGAYLIDPDGGGSEPAFMATCDMSTEGGGWTVVFFAPDPAESGVPINYTSATRRLLADAQRVLLAFRSASGTAYTNYATFDLPDAWRTDAPFDAPGTDVSTGVSINGAALATQTVRFGRANFSNLCSDAWTPTSDYGRICIEGTVAPYYSGFSVAGTDLCSNSSQAYNTTACTNDLRFSIAVQ